MRLFDVQRMAETMSRYIEIFRKVMCMLLSLVLIGVQSGCYSVKVVGSIETLDPYHLSIKKGDTVSIIYYENENVYVIQGRIKEIMSDEIVLITGSISEKNIPLNKIKRINIFEKKYNVILTIGVVALGGWIAVKLFKIIFMPLSGVSRSD